MAYKDAARRQITLAFSAFMLVYNATFLFCIAYLHDELPSGIGESLILYFCVAAVVCLLGLVGTIKQSQTCVDIFANHVLLDAILMTVPRVIFCAFLSSLPGTLCEPSDFPNPFRPPTSPSLPSSAGGRNANSPRATSPDRCFVVMNTLMGLAAFLAVASGAAQWSVALRVREFAKSLNTDGQDGRDDVEEKAGAGLEDGRVPEVTYVDEKKGAVAMA
ncbi:uncharacterized protein BKCO1_1900091 [Diplodia corticola]|uniref:Uncharacterized protein n=1 Tax=Diplodia corticola TaxID=236234 RepID=A0A1J9RRJ4_9PEZI|nr:uncharacterized protein BKCO1_1900091 [Diplodia corticola]OJD35155.1 hypothetical protein BKCO1_1900091 [Diplodia corticola]